MGTSAAGRRRKPHGLRAVQGSRKRPAHRREPKVDPGVPDPPDHLTAAERALWDYYAPLLSAGRVLSKQDRETLAQFCEARAEVEDIKRQQAEPEYRRVLLYVTTSPTGDLLPHVKTNPLDVQRRQWMQIARMCAAELGLSPTSRGRAGALGGQEEPDEFAEFDGLKAVK